MSERLVQGDNLHQIGSSISESECCENQQTVCDRELDFEPIDIAVQIACDSRRTDTCVHEPWKSHGVESEICEQEGMSLFLGTEYIPVREVVRKHAAKLSKKLLKSNSNLELLLLGLPSVVPLSPGFPL